MEREIMLKTLRLIPSASRRRGQECLSSMIEQIEIAAEKR